MRRNKRDCAATAQGLCSINLCKSQDVSKALIHLERKIGLRLSLVGPAGNECGNKKDLVQ